MGYVLLSDNLVTANLGSATDRLHPIARPDIPGSSRQPWDGGWGIEEGDGLLFSRYKAPLFLRSR